MSKWSTISIVLWRTIGFQECFKWFINITFILLLLLRKLSDLHEPPPAFFKMVDRTEASSFCLRTGWCDYRDEDVTMTLTISSLFIWTNPNPLQTEDIRHYRWWITESYMSRNFLQVNQFSFRSLSVKPGRCFTTTHRKHPGHFKALDQLQIFWM